MNPQNKPTVCCRCGASAVVKSTGVNRTIPYRTLPALPLPSDLVIACCKRCKSLFPEQSAPDELRLRLQALYVESLQSRIRTALAVLKQSISQRRLELLLGLSQGYLSRLKAGAGNPSSELVLLLALLSLDPEKQLANLQQFWTLHDSSWHPSAPTMVAAPNREIRRRTTKSGERSRASIPPSELLALNRDCKGQTARTAEKLQVSRDYAYFLVRQARQAIRQQRQECP